MSEGKDSIDLSSLAAAVPNAAGLFASLSILSLRLYCCLSGLFDWLWWFRCRAQRRRQGKPRGVDQGEVSVTFFLFWFVSYLAYFWRFRV